MHSFIKRILTTQTGFGLTVLRVVIGIIFASHGAQKLFSLFGGKGLTGFAMFLESLGVTPSYLMALLAGSAEFFGGVALIIGLLVRPAAVSLIITMLVAIFGVHFKNGLFMSNNGYEFALSLLIASVAIVFEGAGRFSLDRYISNK